MRRFIRFVVKAGALLTAGGIALLCLVLGGIEARGRAVEFAGYAWREVTDRLTIRQTVEIEPDYGEGIRGLIRKYADRHKVPAALALSVAIQEGSEAGHNWQVNCSNRYWKKQPDLRNCALGVMQLIPRFNDIEDPLSILGPDNLERSIDYGIARLRKDFDRAKGKTIQARWYQALVTYYGEESDYQREVFARLGRLALEMEG